jgi:hypothetical protein
MSRVLPSKSFGAVTVETWEKRDVNKVGIGKPTVKVLFPAESFLIDSRGEVVFGEDGHAIRVKGGA